MAADQSQLDVYARPYVPLKWRQFNETASTPVPSAPAPWIDYDEYTKSFAGHAYLRPANTQVHQHGELDHHALELDQTTYSRFFTKALLQETVALQHDVPGLRETSLRIEVGDIVHIRQLRFDKHGEPVVAPAVRDQQGRAITLPKSIDKRHDAVVWRIDRLREIIFLRIDSVARRSMIFNACFTVQARRMNELHLTVQQVQEGLSERGNAWMQSMLFPDDTHGELQHTLNSANFQVRLHDSMLNYEQQKAVQTIVNNEYGRVPYLVSGPPGTGKTKTAVETVLQLTKKTPSSRIILCAPSDPASDTLVQRLSKHLNPKQLLRVNSPSRSFPEVPDSVLPFSYIDNDIFSMPPFPELMQKRVVVVTCRDVDLLRKARVSNQDLFQLERNMHAVVHPEDPPTYPQLHWTGLIIDEAAQATEPEALLPLLFVAPPSELQSENHRMPSVVMVGDQNQLGPRTACNDGAIITSLFERLLARPLYRNHPLARSTQSGGVIRPLTSDMLPIIRPAFSDLVRNYRSHPGILATPSSLFYNDTLEPAAEHTMSLLPWSGFQGRPLPVLFADNRSPDEIERDGGGWFNVGEANLALLHAQSFVRQGLLQPHEICIMSPFRAQVRVLRMQARGPAIGMPSINIGPLEAFQGLESRLVILCTTRTRNRFIEQDLAKGLGVIHEPKRFNVALTRAKEGLIVIGNPHVLGQDENWASFISFCLRTGANSGWTGEHVNDWAPPSGSKIETSRLEKQMSYKSRLDRENDMDAVERRLGHLKFGMSEEEALWESGISAEMAMQEDKGFENGFQ